MRKLAVIALAALAISGCTMLHMSYPEAQSHFVYPNSNVTPLGHASGEASSVGLMPDMQDGDLEMEAINKAIAEKGGDLLVDYHLTTDVKSYPIIPFLPIYVTTVSADGTVAKMEIGKQYLR